MRPYLQLCKFRVAGLLVGVALVTALVSAAAPPSLARLALLALAGGLACISSALLNHYFDRDIDGLMERTRGRPLPSGRIANPRLVFWLGLGMLALALGLSSWLNLLTAAFVLGGALVYVVLYTLWLKRRTPTSTVIGGLSGAFAALAGWASTGGPPLVAPFLIALVVFLWTPPHFWSFALANQADYQQAGVPLVPQPQAAWYILGSASLLVLASLAAYTSGAPFGWVYLGATVLAGAFFLAAEGRLLVDSSRRAAWRGYKVSGAYLAALLLALAFEGLQATS